MRNSIDKPQRSSVAYSVNSKLSFKVIVVGDLAVGKTSLVMRYIKGTFSKDYKVTVGFEFFSKVVHHDDEDVTVQIWDTAGQEAFRSMIRSFYRGAACVIMMFSMAKPQTLEALDKWQAEVREYSHSEVVKVLVGSKSDLAPQNNKWLTTKAEDFCKKNNMDLYMQISSKTSQNVDQLFKSIVEIMYKRYESSHEFRELVMPSKSSFLLGPNDELPDAITSPRRKKKSKEEGGCC